MLYMLFSRKNDNSNMSGEVQYMIKDKKDLVRYLECDRMALKKDYKRPRFMKGYEWRFQILLRKTEYWKNKNGFLKKIIYPYYLFKYKKFPD